MGSRTLTSSPIPLRVESRETTEKEGGFYLAFEEDHTSPETSGGTRVHRGETGRRDVRVTRTRVGNLHGRSKNTVQSPKNGRQGNRRGHSVLSEEGSRRLEPTLQLVSSEGTGG